MKVLLLTIIALSISLPAFAQDITNDIQETRDEVEEVTNPYQTKQDILEAYAEPYYKGGHKDIELWYYPHERMFIFFEHDMVVRIDVVTDDRLK